MNDDNICENKLFSDTQKNKRKIQLYSITQFIEVELQFEIYNFDVLTLVLTNIIKMVYVPFKV